MKRLAKRLSPSLYEALRSLRSWYWERKRLSQWSRIIRRTQDLGAFAGAPDGPRVVLLPMISRMFLTNFEVPLALALAARGAQVEVVFDDATFPLCEMTTGDVVEKGQEPFCRRCIRNMESLTAGLDLRVRLTSEFCDDALLDQFRQQAEGVDVASALSYEQEGIPIGRPAVMVALRHFRKGAMEGLPEEESVLRKYMVSAMISRHVAESLASEGPIHAAMVSHGIYTSWEPVLEVFRKIGVQVAAYDRMPSQHTYQFNWNVGPNTGDISSAWQRVWRERPLTETQRAEALDYLASRETFKRESVKFSTTLPQDPGSLRKQLEIPEDKTALLLVSNLVWDAAAVGRDLIFTDTLDWVTRTIGIVAEHPESLHLVIKPHPAEVLRGTKLFVAEEVRKRMPDLPGNVTLLQADAKINPMSLMKAVDVGISHTSTAGMEMAVLGKPVIPVSQAHYRGQGFTFDPETFEQYERLLAEAPGLAERYTDEMKELAIKYLYVRTSKYQHRIPLAREKGYLNCVGFALDSLDDLLPGRIPDLDFICDAVLSGRRDFVKD